MFKFVVLVLSVFAASAFGAQCTSPKASATSFTSSDATIVSQVASIVDLSFKCSSGEVTQLFAEVAGQVFPVAKVGTDKYQISWNDDFKKSVTGSVNIRLFDEEGYSSIRKAQREGSSISSVKSLTEVVVSIPSVYNGPLINSELLVAVLTIFVAYFAYTTKSKLQA
ncbi:SSR4 family protein [Megaselia abdita]